MTLLWILDCTSKSCIGPHWCVAPPNTALRKVLPNCVLLLLYLPLFPAIWMPPSSPSALPSWMGSLPHGFLLRMLFLVTSASILMNPTFPFLIAIFSFSCTTFGLSWSFSASVTLLTQELLLQRLPIISLCLWEYNVSLQFRRLYLDSLGQISALFYPSVSSECNIPHFKQRTFPSSVSKGPSRGYTASIKQWVIKTINDGFFPPW